MKLIYNHETDVLRKIQGSFLFHFQLSIITLICNFLSAVVATYETSFLSVLTRSDAFWNLSMNFFKLLQNLGPSYIQRLIHILNSPVLKRD